MYWSANTTTIIQDWIKINNKGNADIVNGKYANDFASFADLQSLSNKVNNLVSELINILNKYK